VPPAEEAPHHVAPHAAEPDKPKLHPSTLLWAGPGGSG